MLPVSDSGDTYRDYAISGHAIDLRRSQSEPPRAQAVAQKALTAETAPVWNQPYLETCCRSALHRLYLAGVAGRPADQMDRGCLLRLQAMGLSRVTGENRCVLTADGVQRHAKEILKRPDPTTAAR